MLPLTKLHDLFRPHKRLPRLGQALPDFIGVRAPEIDRDAPRYFMATRTVLETRLYRLYKVSDDPLTLRGELSFNSGIGRPENMTHSDPLHPEYEVELVRISDLAES